MCFGCKTQRQLDSRNKPREFVWNCMKKKIYIYIYNHDTGVVTGVTPMETRHRYITSAIPLSQKHNTGAIHLHRCHPKVVALQHLQHHSQHHRNTSHDHYHTPNIIIRGSTTLVWEETNARARAMW